MNIKEILSATAVVLTVFAFLPYIRSIRRGRTKPHVFSWVIWGAVTLVVFFAQVAGKGGVGAWPVGVGSLLTSYIAILAYVKKGDISITRTDWWFLGFALSSLPLWYLTSNPLSAVIILTLVDLAGYGPTVKKVQMRPFEEDLTVFALMGTRNVIAIAAMEHYSLTTVLFPGVTAVACLSFILMVVSRRARLSRQV